MKIILDSIQPVIQKSKSVWINEDAIRDFAKTLTEKDFALDNFSKELLLNNASSNEQIAFALLFHSINFCYWGEPKWAINIDGSQYDGAEAMAKALEGGIRKGYNLLDARYLADISEEDLQNIFVGNIQIPLFKERLEILRQLGTIVLEKFNGSYSEILSKGEYNTSKIIGLITKEFSDIFNDECDYHGKKVKFYKRAQLLVSHLYYLSQSELIPNKISLGEEFTAFADYKVPQMLRKFRILEYSDNLAYKVDNKIEISSNSDEEMEIRANTIWAVELTTQILKEKFPQARAEKVNSMLWLKSQTKSPDDKPYHRTRTIWY